MHRSTARTLTVISLAGLLAAAALPAQAKSSRPKEHRGKKAMGEILSFDAATSTLVVDLPGDEDFTGAVDPDVKVKLDHRGWAKKSESHGNPSRGSVEDLVAGTAVLRMKVEDDVVTKIRIRPTAEETPAPEADEADAEDALPDDDTPADDTPAEDPATEDPADGDDSADEDTPADDTPADDAPADDAPADDTSDAGAN